MPCSTSCPNRGNGCAVAGQHEHIHLGSYTNHQAPGPLEITLRKADLTKEVLFNLTAESQISTGYMWITMGIYTEHEHATILGNQESFYGEQLTMEFMRDAMKKGMEAHGIAVTPFSIYSGGAISGTERIHGIPVGSGEISKAVLSVQNSIKEGNYYVHFGYVSAFRGQSISLIRELVIKILP
ncbi:F0F1 ATP synthase subunit alpha, putative [Babesia ovis]|uniref:F0F1 ATP synthase subunit alpha, putative n=1 Tax=Babesia ovis TaxID=5869 RepID=A0A9W5WW54_BABOV|nr:F0F1 ATP synthase subunit alpha, putative [Babesia ovis]